MPVPHDLLDALDPEQRQVAEALRGPGPGARRCRHRQDPRDHPPDRLRRGHRRLPAHRGPRGDVHHPRRRRDAHPAAPARAPRASRRAPSTPPRCASCGSSGRRSTAPSCRRSPSPSCRCSRSPRAASRLGADQGLLRDLASEIEWAKVSNVRPDDYAALAPGRGRDVAGHGRRDRGAGVLRLRGRQARPGPDGHGGRAALRRRRCSPTDERVAAQVRRQYKCFVVDEFQDVSPLQSAPARPLAGRPRRALRGRRPGPDDLLASPAPTPPTSATSRASIPGTTSVELVRNYRSTPEVVAAANTLLVRHRLARAWSWPRSGRPARRSPTASTTTRSPRPRRSPPRSLAPARARDVRVRRDGGAVPHQRPVRGVRGRADRAAASRYVVRGAARFFDRPEVRQAVTLLRGTARSGGGGDDLVDDVRATLVRHGLDAPRPPTGRGQARDRWESLQALVAQATAFAAGRRRRPRRLRRRPRPAGRRAARPGRRRRHAGHPARRQGPGVGRRLRLPALQEGTLPITYAEHARGDRGGAPAALRRHDPRPRRTCRSRGAWRATPAAAAPASRRGSSPGCCPRSAAGAPPRRRRAAREAARCRECGRAAVDRRREEAWAAAPTARRRTTRSCSSGCASGGWPARPRRGAGVRRLHRRDAAG